MKLYMSSLLLIFGFSSVFASPLIVAHRAGTADHPENTHHAISMALHNKADVVWLSIQFSQEGIPVLYRPSDLKELTNGHGRVSSYSWQDLQQLDAAYTFNIQGQYIYRGRGINIPSLREIMLSYPDTNFILDIKSPDADPAIIAKTLENLIIETRALDRVTFYSTEKKYLMALPEYINKYEFRNLTRKILTNAIMADDCKIMKIPEGTLNDGANKHHAFELKRDVKVVEKFTLGRGSSRARLIWNQQAMACFKINNDTKVLLIGINSNEDYQLAAALGADYVMVDSPAAARYWR